MCVKALKTKLKVKMAVVMQQEQVVQEKAHMLMCC